MLPIVDKFPTAFYESNDVLVCPNGDKLRSDDEGTFCWLEGDRVPAAVVNGVVVLQPVAVVTVVTASKKKGKADVTEQPGEQQGDQTDANG
jgi:hypothetical protein